MSEFNSSNLETKNVLMYDMGTGIYLSTDSLSCIIHQSTINANVGIVAFGSTKISETVFDCSLQSISGINSGHTIQTSVLTPDYTYIDLIANPSGCSNLSPVFADPSHGDFHSLTGTADNSNYCSSIDLGYNRISNNVTITSEKNAFKTSDISTDDNFINFLYQKNNNIIFSDYNREIAFAKLMYNTSNEQYNYYYTQKTIINDIYTKSAFPVYSSGITWPYDWDYVNIRTPEIKNTNYIVPKSIVDITEVLNNVGLVNSFDINNIKVHAYKNLDRRGITYDYDNSKPGSMIVWTIDNDHILYMRDIYSGEDITSYPLIPPVSPSGENLFIKPSGLIPYGPTSTGYKFLLERDVNTVIEGIDEYGNFEWLPTDKNLNYELYGILAYKDNLYMTANYTIGNKKQSVLLMYPSKTYYKDYIATDPTKFYLNTSNSDPKDITIYEDGTIFIGDGTPSSSGVHIHKYKLRYDYALKDNYDNNYTRLYLREAYSDVTK